ncbi:unnamed protein product [Cuscuta campestris]|uniref:Uncharacterized protein n=1 Tax=Cuscuta campestris TaxID=132261 RepID=A0A484MWK8_9ASTE|nr:unnamed protein product [Cuscuta campestris]
MLSSLLLLSSVAFSTASSSSSSSFPPVVDVDGHVLMTGKPYYALSGLLRHPLGLCLPDDVGQNDVVQCPLLKHDSRGFPVAFTRVKDDDGDEDDREHGRVVREDTFYRVQFWDDNDNNNDNDNDNENNNDDNNNNDNDNENNDDDDDDNDNNCGGDDGEIGGVEERRRRRRSDTTNVWYLKKGDVSRRVFVAVGSKSNAVKSVRFAIKRVTLGYKLVYCVQSPKRKGSSFPACFGVGLIRVDRYNHLGIGLGARPVQFFFKKKTDDDDDDDDMPHIPEMSRHLVVNNTNTNNIN